MNPSTRTPSVGDSGCEPPVVFSAFLLTGITAALLGPLIPELEALWDIDHAQSGSLFLVQFAASSVAAIVSNFNLRRSLVAGYALSAVSLFGLVYGGWPLARAFMAVSGLSLGLVISGSNLLVAEKNPGRRGAALSSLNLTWGIGAVASPLLVAVFVESFGAFALLRVLGVAAGIASLVLAAVVRNPERLETLREATRAGASPSPVLRLALVGALFFFYVGTEISVGGWMVSLAEEFSTGHGIVSLVIGSGFWAAVLLGRASAALALRRLSETRVYTASLGLAAIGLICLYLAGSQAAVATGAILSGLGLAALFPLTVSILSAVSASNRAHVPGLLLACGGLGGSLLPWLTGRVAQAGGEASSIEASLSRGFLVPIAGLLILSCLYALYLRTAATSQTRRAPAP